MHVMDHLNIIDFALPDIIFDKFDTRQESNEETKILKIDSSIKIQSNDNEFKNDIRTK